MTAGEVTVTSEPRNVKVSTDIEVDGRRLETPYSDEEWLFLMRWARDRLDQTIDAMEEAGGAEQLRHQAREAGRL